MYTYSCYYSFRVLILFVVVVTALHIDRPSAVSFKVMISFRKRASSLYFVVLYFRESDWFAVMLIVEFLLFVEICIRVKQVVPRSRYVCFMRRLFCLSRVTFFYFKSFNYAFVLKRVWQQLLTVCSGILLCVQLLRCVVLTPKCCKNLNASLNSKF